jgi:hypothetical protein
VSLAAITLCVASQRVFIFVSVYFVIDSVRKLLVKPSYTDIENVLTTSLIQFSRDAVGVNVPVPQRSGASLIV